MRIKHVERYTIPIESRFELTPGSNEGTKVRDLSAALDNMPNGGVVSLDYNGTNIFVTYVNADIEA